MESFSKIIYFVISSSRAKRYARVTIAETPIPSCEKESWQGGKAAEARLHKR